MLAEDLAREFPAVDIDGDAMEAARLLAEQRLPGLVVIDESGRPYSVLPGSQVLRFVIPNYVQEDLSLARVYDEKQADKLCSTLAGKRVRELLPRKLPELPVVDPDATVMEIAAVMARMHSPVVAVAQKKGPLVGVITVADLLQTLLPQA